MPCRDDETLDEENGRSTDHQNDHPDQIDDSYIYSNIRLVVNRVFGIQFQLQQMIKIHTLSFGFKRHLHGRSLPVKTWITLIHVHGVAVRIFRSYSFDFHFQTIYAVLFLFKKHLSCRIQPRKTQTDLLHLKCEFDITEELQGFSFYQQIINLSWYQLLFQKANNIKNF